MNRPIWFFHCFFSIIFGMMAFFVGSAAVAGGDTWIGVAVLLVAAALFWYAWLTGSYYEEEKRHPERYR